MMNYDFTDIDVNALVGKRIQKKRKELGYTGMQIAEKIGVSQQQFSRYERGMNKIDLSYLVLLANYLNTPIYWFFEDCFISKSSSENQCTDKRSSIIAEAMPDVFLY
ncbi:helix-turn-helix domain-containing protein [Proteus sp. DFP240708]|nr:MULTISPECIES: helix-turn-helix transcriptional regulator [Proteus]GLX63911.1 hypothetical protein KMU_19520 [Proteus vulgaris]